MIEGTRQKENGERWSGHPNFIVGQNRESCLITVIQVCVSKATHWAIASVLRKCICMQICVLDTYVDSEYKLK
jgi:hypothetical protein